MRGNTSDQQGWTDLERALRGRPGPEPAAAFGNRVLDGVRHALAEPARPPAPRWGVAAHWAAVAAVLIVGLALSQMAASVTPFFERGVPATHATAVHATAHLMRQVSPGLTQDEADRLALASAVRGELLPVPIANSDTTFAARPLSFNPQGDLR